jgi:hypothetical protein
MVLGRRGVRALFTLSVLFCLALVAGTGSAPASQADYDRGYEIGIDAYKYGLPLLTMKKTYRNQTSVNLPDGRGFGPPNRFNAARRFANPRARSVVAANFDTLYSVAWINLKRQPKVIHVPKIRDRYFVIPLMSPYTENFRNLGSVNRTRPGDYAIVGPGQYRTKLPKGVRRIKSPYSRVWILERIFARPESDRDISKVHRIQKRTTVTPLSKYGKRNWKRPRPEKIDTKVDEFALPRRLAYFNRLGRELEKFPPPAADEAELEKLARVGIGPGLRPEEQGLDPDTLSGLRDAVADGPSAVDADLRTAYLTSFADHNGYLVSSTGRYGTDYASRATVTRIGLGALVPTEAIYPFAQTDRSLAPLSGSKKYTMHIPAGQLPPARAFWSLTLYDLDGYLVPNPADRYALHDRTDLQFNPDGSLDLNVQSSRPSDPGRVRNWLPSPADGGGFRLIWRIYDPQPALVAGILDGSGWTAPAVLKSE